MENPPPLPPPPAVRRPPRPDGTYSAHFEGDADPRRGRNLLVAFALVSLLLECGWMLLIVSSQEWSFLFGAGSRLLLVWGLVIALWSGAGWTRWPLAALNFCVGGWLLVQSLGHGLFIAVPGLTSHSLRLAQTLPVVLGVFYLAATGWCAFSADLSAFVERQRAGMTTGDRLAIAALLACCLALPAGGWGWWAVRTWAVASRAKAASQRATEEVRLHGAQGREFALGLIREAIRQQDFSVLEKALTPTRREELRQILGADWAARKQGQLANAGTLVRVEASPLSPYVGLNGESKADCKVVATCERGKMEFYCYLERVEQPPGWALQSISVE